MVAEVGVKTYTVTWQTHILILPDSCTTKLSQRRVGKKKKKPRQTHQAPHNVCFIRGDILGLFASLNEESQDFFTWAKLGGSAEAHTDTSGLFTGSWRKAAVANLSFCLLSNS